MSDIDFAFLFDAVMAVLLVVTIVYAAVLNRKLSALRESREEMQGLIEEFASATTRTEQGLAELKTMAEASGNLLQERIDSAKNLVADINFVVKRGDEVANRMEEAIRASRRTAADPMMAGPVTADRVTADRVTADRVRSAAAPQGGGAQTQVRTSERPSAFKAARSFAEEDAAPNPLAPEKQASQAASAAKRALSAEQSQLLKALQGMR